MLSFDAVVDLMHAGAHQDPVKRPEADLKMRVMQRIEDEDIGDHVRGGGDRQ